MYNRNEIIEPINVSDEMSRSFLDYSMSVIISRALPDARDGLKPSQRRILFAMRELGVLPNRKHLKCAKIVGETMGNYHPHGDQAIYPTLVHMAQTWAMRDTLIEGQGNFGSVEGDPPASMRYTEARLTHLGAVLMDDMDKSTVDFIPNYDDTRVEPTVFPAAFPNLLINGGTGIAVGMATNMAPHNLGEVVDGVCAQIDNPQITAQELMRHIKGPDFPTGCQICGIEGIRDYFATGRGSVKVRGRAVIEELKGGREQIVITEIPYNVNRAVLVSRIAELVNEKILTDISEVRDESDANTRVVVQLKREGIPRVVLNNLYKHTSLATSFSVNALAIDRGRPRVLSLKEAIACYIEHRREVILRRTRHLLREAEERAEKLEAYLIALANLDEFIRIIRTSETREEARQGLARLGYSAAEAERFGVLIRSQGRLDAQGQYRFTERQVESILELRLYQLVGLERDKISAEYAEIMASIQDLLDILAREERVLQIIKDELRAIKAKYGTPRYTEIVPDEGEINMEDLIANQGAIVTMSHAGYIKRTAVSNFRAQRRGGKGVKGMATKEGSGTEEDPGDFVERLFTASTHDFLMFLTNTGRCYVEKVYEIPEMGRSAKGRSIANILELKPGEKIAVTMRIESRTTGSGPATADDTWSQDRFILFATRSGIVKKTNLSEFRNVNRSGIIAIKIEDKDELIAADLIEGGDDAVLITHDGMSIRFPESDVRDMGRSAVGVWGIKLEPKDYVVAQAVVNPVAHLLVVGENGIGKRTAFEEYRAQTRGGKGIITMKTGDKTGAVVAALSVTDQDELMLITTGGQMVRTRVREIRETGRNTSGVKIIGLKSDTERLQAVARVVSDAEEDPNAPLLPGMDSVEPASE